MPDCRPEEQYRTPPGYYDRFFVYAYDADALVDGLDYRGLPVQVESRSDFIMRKISGGPQVTVPVGVLPGPPYGRLQFYNPDGVQVSRAPLYSDHYRSLAVIPELRYPAGSAIVFDLYAVFRASHWVGDDEGVFGVTYLSQLAFHGVKRAQGEPDDKSGYRYYEKPYTYHYQLLIDWRAYSPAGLFAGAAPPHRFYLPIDHCDFELHQIAVTVTGTGTVPAIGTLAYMMLYDQNSRGCSNAPLWMNYLETNAPDSFGNVITPPLLYRTGSQIMFDITSKCLLSIGAPDLPLNLDIDFAGVRRLPC